MTISSLISPLTIHKSGPNTLEMTFTISGEPDKPSIQTCVKEEGQIFFDKTITTLPASSLVGSAQKIITFLQNSVIDFINEKIFIFLDDPLSTYNLWKEELAKKNSPEMHTLLQSRIAHLESDNAVARIQSIRGSSAESNQRYILLGDKYMELGFYEEANVCYQRSLRDIYILKDNLEVLGIAHGSLGVVYKEMGDESRSLRFHQVAFEVAKLLKNDLMAAKTHLNVGSAYMGLDKASEALVHFRQHFRYAKQHKNSDEMRCGYQNIGTALDTLGEFDKAIAEYKNALSLTKKPLDRGGLHINLGVTYNKMGLYQQALEAYHAAEKYYAQIGLKLGALFEGLANVYSNLGEYKKSLNYHQKALIIHEKENHLSHQALALANIGNVYELLGNLETQQAEYLRKDVKEEVYPPHWEDSVEAYLKSLEIAKRIGHKTCQSGAEMCLSKSYFVVGKIEESLEFFRQALQTQRTVQDPSIRIQLYQLGGKIHLCKGDFEPANICLQEALSIAQRHKILSSEGSLYLNLGILEMERERFAEAGCYFKQSIAIFSTMQNHNTSNDLQKGVSFFETTFHPYRLLEQVLLLDLQKKKENKIPGDCQTVPLEEILAMSDVGRASALVNVLKKKHELEDVNELTFEEIQKLVKRWQTTLIIYSCDLSNINKGWCWILSPEGKIEIQMLDLEPIWKEMEFRSSRSSYLRNPNSLEDKTTLFRGATQISYVLDWLTEESEPVRGEGGQSTGRKQHVLNLWYNTLIRPIEPFLPAKIGSRLTIIPDSVIHQLPFEAFMNSDKKALIDRFTIQMVPSIKTFSLLEEIEQKHKSTRKLGTACIIADPQMGGSLKGALEEGQTVKKFFKTPLFFEGNDATKAALLKNISSAGYIHLACHGRHVSSNGTPIKKDIYSVFQGSLLLSDGELFADDVAEVSLNADLAILSACESGKGNLWKEGVVGLSHAFFAAGVSTVIATRWEVPDEQTKMMIDVFYRSYFGQTELAQEAQKQGNPFGKAEALREAILACKKKYPAKIQAWGGFFLSGLPGPSSKTQG